MFHGSIKINFTLCWLLCINSWNVLKPVFNSRISCRFYNVWDKFWMISYIYWHTRVCWDNLLITQIVCVEVGLHEPSFNDFAGLCSTWLLTMVVLPIYLKDFYCERRLWMDFHKKQFWVCYWSKGLASFLDNFVEIR